MQATLQFDLTAEEQEVFCTEADELIALVDRNLLLVERQQATPESVQDLFRAAHTLKSSSAAIGHTRMASLTHAMESVLEPLRQSQAAPPPELTDLLLTAADALRELNQEVTTGISSGIDPATLIERLLAWAPQAGAAPALPAAPIPAAPVPLNGLTAPTFSVPLQVVATISPESIAPAARALQVLLALDECGRIVCSEPSREVIESGVPMPGVQVVVETTLTGEELQQRLRHIGELNDMSIGPWKAPPVEAAALVPAGDAVGEDEPKPSPESVDGNGAKGAAALGAKNITVGIKTVRTSVERLDKLMDLVGELVTDRNRLLQTHALLSARYADSEHIAELARGISHLASITDELQEEVMRARMLPLEHAFSKLPRVVRDLAHEVGKTVFLEIEGQDTELDRTVIEQIGDPLLHLLRNAVDHGIEPLAERRAAGKPDHGVIRLSGRSVGDHIVITVSDDGRGIDVARVRQKAIDKGLLTAEAAAHLTESEALDLIFLPGLSTAKQVTDVSGRGVGMDVVRTNIEHLHGSVTVKSTPGKGTTFELRLPLTLAIMPVLLVQLSSYTYCVPLNTVTEVFVTDPVAIHRIERSEVILWRERLLPLLRLSSHFGLQSPAETSEQKLSTVAVHWGDDHLGLVVDRLLGQQEIVVKNLGHMIGQAPGLSGSAILGDGSVALIIDVPELIKRAARLSNEVNSCKNG